GAAITALDTGHLCELAHLEARCSFSDARDERDASGLREALEEWRSTSFPVGNSSEAVVDAVTTRRTQLGPPDVMFSQAVSTGQDGARCYLLPTLSETHWNRASSMSGDPMRQIAFGEVYAIPSGLKPKALALDQSDDSEGFPCPTGVELGPLELLLRWLPGDAPMEIQRLPNVRAMWTQGTTPLLRVGPATGGLSSGTVQVELWTTTGPPDTVLKFQAVLQAGSAPLTFEGAELGQWTFGEGVALTGVGAFLSQTSSPEDDCLAVLKPSASNVPAFVVEELPLRLGSLQSLGCGPDRTATCRVDLLVRMGQALAAAPKCAPSIRTCQSNCGADASCIDGCVPRDSGPCRRCSLNAFASCQPVCPAVGKLFDCLAACDLSCRFTCQAEYRAVSECTNVDDCLDALKVCE
ncbi:MAG: hypothetical protein ACI9MR_002943, partial [Myxococcota bacterium]